MSDSEDGSNMSDAESDHSFQGSEVSLTITLKCNHTFHRLVTFIKNLPT